jgi:Bardet-Biedl syndrome 2 protein
MDGREGVVVVSTEGEIRGYIAKERGQDDGMHSLTDSHALKEQLIKLTHQRNGLLLDLANYENSIKSSKKGEGEGRELANVPLDTNISFGLRYTDTMDKLFLVLRTNNDTHVKAVVALSDALFENESMVEIPAKPSTSLEIKLSLNKNIAAAVLVKAVVGYPGSTQDHVFQEQYQLPRFSNFCPVPNGKAKEPSGKLVFTVNERANRVMMWISRAFYLGNIGDLPKHLSGVDMSFKNIREEGKDLRLTMQGSEGGVMTIACDDMELAGDIVQDMCATLKIKTLEAEADFQSEEKEFLKVLDEINDYKSIAKKLSAEIADSTQILKNMIVQAEDARINAAMDIMCSVYAQVFNLNQELISEYRKRETNHQNLAKSLKVVQKMIQKASRLRMGAVQSRVVKLCREAMKPLNPKKMLNSLKTGGGAGY